jgi:hypothetical protein
MFNKRYLFLVGFALIFIFLAMNLVSSQITITACGGTYDSGQYELNQSITGTGTCLSFNNSNIEIDCKGHSILYGSDGVNGRIGINAILGTVYLSNITIKNCIIQDINAAGTTGYGIMFTRVSDSYIVNNTIQTNGTTTNYGIFLEIGSENNQIENNTINAFGSTTANMGIYIHYQSNGNIVRGNTITGTGTTTSYALNIYSSDNNLVENNSLSSLSPTLTAGNATNMHTVYLVYGTKNNTIRDNYIYSEGATTNYNVYLYLNANANYIQNNIIIANGTRAVAAESGGSNVGVYILDSNENIVENNTIYTYGTTANYGISVGVASLSNILL